MSRAARLPLPPLLTQDFSKIPRKLCNYESNELLTLLSTHGGMDESLWGDLNRIDNELVKSGRDAIVDVLGSISSNPPSCVDKSSNGSSGSRVIKRVSTKLGNRRYYAKNDVNSTSKADDLLKKRSRKNRMLNRNKKIKALCHAVVDKALKNGHINGLVKDKISIMSKSIDDETNGHSNPHVEDFEDRKDRDNSCLMDIDNNDNDIIDHNLENSMIDNDISIELIRDNAVINSNGEDLTSVSELNGYKHHKNLTLDDTSTSLLELGKNDQKSGKSLDTGIKTHHTLLLSEIGDKVSKPIVVSDTNVYNVAVDDVSKHLLGVLRSESYYPKELNSLAAKLLEIEMKQLDYRRQYQFHAHNQVDSSCSDTIVSSGDSSDRSSATTSAGENSISTISTVGSSSSSSSTRANVSSSNTAITNGKSSITSRSSGGLSGSSKHISDSNSNSNRFSGNTGISSRSSNRNSTITSSTTTHTSRNSASRSSNKNIGNSNNSNSALIKNNTSGTDTRSLNTNDRCKNVGSLKADDFSSNISLNDPLQPPLLGKRGRRYFDVWADEDYVTKTKQESILKVSDDWSDIIRDYSDTHDGQFIYWSMQNISNLISQSKSVKVTKKTKADDKLLNKDYITTDMSSFSFIPPPIPVSHIHPASWGINARDIARRTFDEFCKTNQNNCKDFTRFLIVESNNKLAEQPSSSSLITLDTIQNHQEEINIPTMSVFECIHPASYSSTVVLPPGTNMSRCISTVEDIDDFNVHLETIEQELVAQEAINYMRLNKLVGITKNNNLLEKHVSLKRKKLADKLLLIAQLYDPPTSNNSHMMMNNGEYSDGHLIKYSSEEEGEEDDNDLEYIPSKSSNRLKNSPSVPSSVNGKRKMKSIQSVMKPINGSTSTLQLKKNNLTKPLESFHNSLLLNDFIDSLEIGSFVETCQREVSRNWSLVQIVEFRRKSDGTIKNVKVWLLC